MKKINNIEVVYLNEMTDLEMLDIFGGGGISDLVVKGLTWIGDHIIAVPGPVGPIFLYH